MGTLARVFPALEALETPDTNRVELVNQTIVEEVLQDLGVLDFGKGITADFECQHLARARHSPPAVRRVRVPGQIQAPGRNSREGDKPLSAVLRRTAAVRSRLAVPRYDQDWARLSAERQSTPEVMNRLADFATEIAGVKSPSAARQPAGFTPGKTGAADQCLSLGSERQTRRRCHRRAGPGSERDSAVARPEEALCHQHGQRTRRHWSRR